MREKLRKIPVDRAIKMAKKQYFKDKENLEESVYSKDLLKAINSKDNKFILLEDVIKDSL